MVFIRQFLAWSGTFFICGLIAYSLFSQQLSTANSPPQEKSAPAVFPELVEAATAQTVEWSPSLTVQGEVVAPQIIQLQSEAAGRIISLKLPSGGQVKKGQLLLRLDSSEEQAQLKNAQAKVELARLELKRFEKLVKKSMVSQESVDKAQADLKIYQAEIEAIQALIRKKSIIAPFDGWLGLHNLEVGQLLSANSPITSLVGNSSFVWVDFKVPQPFHNLQQNHSVTVYSLDKQYTYIATIAAHNPVMNSQSRTMLYRAKLEKLPTYNTAHFKQGQSVRVKVATGKPQLMLQIPNSAIVREPFADFVYGIQPAPDGENYLTQKKKIKVISQNAQYSMVSEGIVDGERIVSNGAFKLYPEQLISIKAAAELSMEKPSLLSMESANVKQ